MVQGISLWVVNSSGGGMKMIETLKKVLLLVALLGQVVGLALLVINIWLGVLFYIFYVIALISLFIVLIVERAKEKEEDDKNDYSDY
ncbi:hypothetical protein [Sutcliffiella horikoshii]|uniref:hypothetical protein n=1 Tax=Sutcliffiella horikoshii TaxID=79883 RepID=UPI001CFC6997|nr:hypothetical protein [Sutcliffiella horikoshii]